MRPLHWTKVPMAEVAHSIWAQLPAYEADEEALKRLFTIKVAPKKQRSTVDMMAQSANKKVMLLDLKRSNQINIALAKFRKQGTNVGEEVVAALRKLDDKFIKLEDIPRIRDLVPTAEETEMLAPYLGGSEPTAKLDGAEKFLLEMCKVRPCPRVGCARYTLEMCKVETCKLQAYPHPQPSPQPGGRPQAAADVLADDANLRDALPRPAGAAAGHLRRRQVRARLAEHTAAARTRARARQRAQRRQRARRCQGLPARGA